MACFSYKRGYVGIGALIILIAVILVSAIAAGVIIRTSSTLQNRALATGASAQDLVSTGVEIMSVKAYVDVPSEEIYGYELVIRVLPSSGSINPESMLFGYRHRNARYEGMLQSTNHQSFQQMNHNTVVDASFDDDYNGVFTLPETLNLEQGNSVPEAFGLTQTYLQGTDTHALLLLKSSVYKTSGDWNLSSIRNGTDFGLYYPFTAPDAYVPLLDDSIDQVLAYANISIVGGTADVVITTESDSCDWDYITRNNRFCLTELIGNGNDFLDESELWRLRFRVSIGDGTRGGATTSEEVELRIFTRTGMMTSHTLWTPNTLRNPLEVLYP